MRVGQPSDHPEATPGKAAALVAVGGQRECESEVVILRGQPFAAILSIQTAFGWSSNLSPAAQELAKVARVQTRRAILGRSTSAAPLAAATVRDRDGSSCRGRARRPKSREELIGSWHQLSIKGITL
jgi:hypothetical protein